LWWFGDLEFIFAESGGELDDTNGKTPTNEPALVEVEKL
jgi:hypothetical protein